MIRITIELVPYGSEELAQTISEVCIEEVSKDTYEAAGYEVKSGKISEVAARVLLDKSNSKLKLVGKVLLEAGQINLKEVKLGEKLIARTRLIAGEKERNDDK